MNKYDAYIEQGQRELKSHSEKWKNTNETIRNKEYEKESLEIDDVLLQEEIKNLEEKQEVLKSSKGEKRKSLLKIVPLYGLMELIALVFFNFPYDGISVTEIVSSNLILNVGITALVIFFGRFSYKCEIQEIRKIEKEYNLDELTTNIDSNRIKRQKIQDKINMLSSDLEKLYGEKEDLKDSILAIYNKVSEMESKRQSVVERVMVPLHEEVLDKDFSDSYGQDNPLDDIARKRKIN